MEQEDEDVPIHLENFTSTDSMANSTDKLANGEAKMNAEPEKSKLLCQQQIIMEKLDGARDSKRDKTVGGRGVLCSFALVNLLNDVGILKSVLRNETACTPSQFQFLIFSIFLQ